MAHAVGLLGNYLLFVFIIWHSNRSLAAGMRRMSRRSYIRAVIHHVWLKQSDAGRKNWGKEDAVVIRLVSLMVLHGLNPFVCRRRENCNLNVAGAGGPEGVR